MIFTVHSLVLAFMGFLSLLLTISIGSSIKSSTESMYGIVEGMSAVEVECENEGFSACKFIFNPEMKEVPKEQKK